MYGNGGYVMLEEIIKSSAGLIWKIANNFYGVDKKWFVSSWCSWSY